MDNSLEDTKLKSLPQSLDDTFKCFHRPKTPEKLRKYTPPNIPAESTRLQDYLKQTEKCVDNVIDLLKTLYYNMNIENFNSKEIYIQHTNTIIDFIWIPETTPSNCTQVNINEYILRASYYISDILCLSVWNSEYFTETDETQYINPSEFETKDMMSDKDLIGQGGYGTVYKNTYRGTPVAVKFMKPKSSKNSIKKFYREYTLIKEIDHPSIIKTHGYTKYEDRIGIILDYCPKSSLNELLKNENLSLKKRLKLLLKVSQSIEYLHILNICHFDIKPHNILINSYYEPKLSDFGISKKLYCSSNKKSMGTIKYCSPEQIIGNPGKSSDVWSFGITMFCVLTGVKPFEGVELDKNNFFAYVYKENNRPVFPENFVKNNLELVEFIRTMWNPVPEARPTMKIVRRFIQNCKLFE